MAALKAKAQGAWVRHKLVSNLIQDAGPSLTRGQSKAKVLHKS